MITTGCNREVINQVLDEYDELRGWNKRSGLPTGKKRYGLSLHGVAAELNALGKTAP